jgi:hypothetical protein
MVPHGRGDHALVFHLTSLLNAPRTLKEPVFCRFSSFRYTSAPERLLREFEGMSGVRWMNGPMFFRACSMSW